jgi:glycosyltransferase involved in cell wall biosynthesis
MKPCESEAAAPIPAGQGRRCASVSVVVPILNEADSLPSLLAGLAGQTCLPSEILLSDAGSTDGSAQLAETWWREHGVPETTLRVLQSPGALPGGGRNNGVCAASSLWVAFIDGGIVPEPDWLERLLTCAEADGSRAVFGTCDFEGQGVIDLATCALSYGQGAVHAVLPASLFRRDLFAETGAFREDLRSAEDLLWLQQLDKLMGRRQVCGGARVHYRHFPASFAATFRKWRENEKNSVRAGVRSRQHGIYLAALPVSLAVAILTPLGFFAALLIYLLLRGVVDPIRRSRNWRWWAVSPLAVIAAPALAVTIDAAKCLGILEGTFEAGFRRGLFVLTLTMLRGLAWCCLILVLVGTMALATAGYWLVDEAGEPQPADAVVVLAGGFERSVFAADLVSRGLAPRVLISRPAREDGATLLESYGVRLPHEEDIALAILVGKGIARDRIDWFGHDSRSTYDEGIALREFVSRHRGMRLLVVTSPTHVRRASLILSAALKNLGVDIQVVGTPYEHFDRFWWRDQSSARAVILETAKLALYLTGGRFSSQP